MKVNKKATVRAIEYCTKLSGRKLGASTSWEQCFEIAMEGFLLGVQTHCEKDGDETVLTLYKEPGEKDDIIETFRLPNDDCFDWQAMEHQWNFIWKYVTEWLIKNHKKIAKPQKAKRKPKLSAQEIKSKLKELEATLKSTKEKISKIKGADRKKLVEEYNDVSRQIEYWKSLVPEEKKPAKPKEAPAKTPKEIGVEKLRLKALIRYGRMRGEDVTEYEKQLQLIEE